MTTNPEQPFERRETVDKPGIVGARWWNEAVAKPVPRRQAMVGCMALGGILAGVAALGTLVVAGQSCSSSSTEPPEGVQFQPRGALDMQREYGWDFGARGEALVFNGESTQAFDRSRLDAIDTDLTPGSTLYTRFFIPTLFASTDAKPRSTPSGETSLATFAPLKDVVKPIFTTSMDTAYKQGQALAAGISAALADKARAPATTATTFIVDLTGPESVAFAAGAASLLEPVFLFDNWPHPRGVVPAHTTLAAAAYYQPLFARTRDARTSDTRTNPLALFVLDRNRLNTYTDDAAQFDNRHVAKLPSADALRTLGVKRVVYVTASGRELDDVNDDFVAWAAAGIAIAIAAPALDGPSYLAAPPYTPAPRQTPFSSGLPASSASANRPRPSNFGMVPVAIAVATGVVLGARASRSGSWNRTSSSSSGS